MLTGAFLVILVQARLCCALQARQKGDKEAEDEEEEEDTRALWPHEGKCKNFTICSDNEPKCRYIELTSTQKLGNFEGLQCRKNNGQITLNGSMALKVHFSFYDFPIF